MAVGEPVGGRRLPGAWIAPKMTPRRWGILGTLAALLILPPILGRVAPVLFNDYYLGIASRAVITIIGALALNLLLGYAGQISLGHAAFIGIGAFTTGYLTWWWGFPFITGLVASAVLGGLMALLVGIPALRIRGLYLAVSTLGFGVVMEKMVFNIEGLTGGQGGTTVYRPKVLSFLFVLNADYFVLCLAILIGVWLLDRAVVASKVGRAFFAIREDEDVAASFGVDVARYKLLAFTMSGIIAGISGSLYGSLILIAQVQEFTFETLSILFLIIVVVGGLGSRVGVAVAATFFVMFSRLLPPSWAQWVPVIGAGLLVLTVARNPQGLAQGWVEARERKAAKAARAGELEEDDLPSVLPSLPAISGGLARNTSAAQAGQPVLAAKEIVVNFGGLRAVNGASLEVPAGKIVGLIGPNGAGKTTMFNVLSGFVKPDSGSVFYQGEDVTAVPAHGRAARGVGRTFQLIGLAKNLTVRENFLLAQHPLARYGTLPALFRFPSVGVTERELESRTTEAISALGFERFTDTPVRNLSHGQQRLVELGCAVVTSPDLLLLDEPSGGMSPAAAESLAERMIDLRDKLGRTVLLIEHHIPLVLAVCDEVYVLNLGEILAHGTTEEIVRNPDVVAAYFGDVAGAK